MQNYWTIQDTKTDLEPGLNIILGKNGVGKSNFIRYLKTSIDFNIRSVSYHNAHLVFSRDETTGFSIDIKSKIEKIIENGTPIIKTNQAHCFLPGEPIFQNRESRQAKIEKINDFHKHFFRLQMMTAFNKKLLRLLPGAIGTFFLKRSPFAGGRKNFFLTLPMDF